MDHGRQSQGSFECFPTEVLLAIFCALPDISSLNAISRTCSLFHNTFRHSQDSIIDTVLSNDIHPSVMAEAVVAWESSRSESWSNAQKMEFLMRYRETSISTPKPKWTLPHALKFSLLHDHVQFFTKEYCSSVLSRHPVSRIDELKYTPPTSSEICRIQRVFYTFELYCNLFRRQSPRRKDKDVFISEDQQAYFFSKFMPWENEQLACIYSYLMLQLGRYYDEVATHDVEWGQRGVNIYQDIMFPNPQKEGILSRGLEFLRRLVLAETYEQRRHLLGHVRSNPFFLGNGLEAQYGNGDFTPTESDEDKERINKTLTSLRNKDNGPIEAWYWANGDEVPYYRSDKADLRDWGYCLWDYRRLVEWGLFRKPWNPERSALRYDRLLGEANELERTMNDSQDERTRIWKLGGSGWWAEGDESKIIWAPLTEKKAEKKPLFKTWEAYQKDIRMGISKTPLV